jgi:hypothetical protein
LAGPVRSGCGANQIAGEGYAKQGDRTAPYDNYYFRVLKGQGPDAPGGATDQCSRAFDRRLRLDCVPAEYHASGIKSFMVNQTGIVYGRDLGPNTGTIARDIVMFKPDKSWLPEMWEC